MWLSEMVLVRLSSRILVEGVELVEWIGTGMGKTNVKRKIRRRKDLLGT
jgi:hypothetical protein